VSGLLEDLLTQLDGSYRIDRELGGGKVASSSRRDRARPLLCRLWHTGRWPEWGYPVIRMGMVDVFEIK